MEIQYGISIKNKYDLFLENDDPLELLQKQEELRLAAKKAVKAKKLTTDKEVKPKKKEKIPDAGGKTPVQESSDKGVESATAPEPRKKARAEGQSRPLKERGNRPPAKTDSQADHSLKSVGEETKSSDTTKRGFGARAYGRGRGAQNGERRGFGNFSGFRNLENQENVDREPQEGRRGGFRGSRFGGNNRPADGGEKDELNPKFASGFAESRTFRGRGFGGGGGRRGYNRAPRGSFNRGGGGGERFSGPLQEASEATEEVSKAEDNQTVKPETPAGEIGHWENEGDGEARGEGRGGSRGRGGFGRRGRSRGRGGGFGGPRRDFNRPQHDGARGGGRQADKKDGSGSHNWGTVMDDLEAQKSEADPSPAAAAAPPAATGITNAKTSWADMADEEMPQTGGEDAAGELAATLMTLDEYKAAEESKRIKSGFNIRKPNEGCNAGEWKKTFVLKKKSQETGVEEEADEDRHGKTPKGTKEHHKVSLEIPITFSDSRRMGSAGARGGAGRRGGGRGGAGGGGGFEARNASGGGGFEGRRDFESRGGEGRGGGGEGRSYEGGRGPYENKAGGSYEGRGAYKRGGGGGGGGSGGGNRRTPRERVPDVADENLFPSLSSSTTLPQ